jgi:NAD(P)-dependent dehydrogenase (short-subunit alcohol dehydrogenase family)
MRVYPGADEADNAQMTQKRIVIVGGAGFLGSRAVASLRGNAGCDVVVAGRRGPLVVDLHRPDTFSALEGADVVVNASSSHAADPSALASFCLARGLVLLEASSDRVVVEGLLARRGGAAAGTLVLGAGIYTGLSNLVVAAAAAACPEVQRVEIGIRSSPFSGAGQGTVDLMIDAMAVPARVVSGGAAVTTPSALPGPVLPFPRGVRRTLTFSFPEVAMLHASTGAADVVLGFAPAPALLWPSFRYLPTWLMTSMLFRRLMGAYFFVLRQLVLRRVSTRVELVGRATGPKGQRLCSLVADDGMAAGGTAIAAMALALAQRRPAPGTFTVDEVLTLEDTIAAMRSLSPQLALQVTGPSSGDDRARHG